MSVKKPLKIAVIGSGISGISAAWMFGEEHDVTLFEKNATLGGHTNTIELELKNGTQPVDTGFIVFNQPNYPYLTKLLTHLNIATQPTEMSFSVSVNQGQLEYAGTNLKTLFAQKRNLLSLSHWKMLQEIVRFNKQAKQDLSHPNESLFFMNLGSYLEHHGFSKLLSERYLLPMAGAIWSCPVETMLKFPVHSFLRFFENHGLLNVNDRPQWETIKGGAKTYLEAICETGNFEVRTSTSVLDVNRLNSQLLITLENGSIETFDHIIFACHADQAYNLLHHSLRFEYDFLSNFQYQTNVAYLHSDPQLMPKRRAAWASWNYLKNEQDNQSDLAVTYWMNLLQNLECEEPIFVTLNPTQKPAHGLTHQKIIYEHPVFDSYAYRAQKLITEMQGQNNLWFCGAYTGYGFHEDGLRSSVELANTWEINLPWEAKTSHANKTLLRAGNE